MNLKLKKIWLVGFTALALGAIGATQLTQLIKIVGVGAAVKQFGPDINKGINKLSGHTDTNRSMTKVVPIISVGVGTQSAIGAAQVMGAKVNVDKVEAVAQPSGDLLGHEVRIRALIPVATKDVKNGIKAVDGVGVSGIVDLKL
jgi:hypothetical protein